MLKLVAGAMLLLGLLGTFIVGAIIAANSDMHPPNAYVPELWNLLPWLIDITIGGLIIGALCNRFHTRDYFY